MKNLFFALTAIVFSVASVSSATADIVYSNNFDSDALGGVTAPFGHAGGVGSHTDVVAADAIFSSQYLEIASRSDNGNFGFGFYDGADGVATNVATFSFDARFNTADFGTYSRIRVRARPIGFSGGDNDITRVDVGAGGGPVPTLDVINHYDYAINNSNIGATIEGLGGTLAAGTWAVYENGVSIGTGSVRTVGQGNTVGSTIDYLTLWVQGDNAGTQGIARIDNFTVRNNAFAVAVPEPGSLALFGLGALGLVVRRRR